MLLIKNLKINLRSTVLRPLNIDNCVRIVAAALF